MVVVLFILVILWGFHREANAEVSVEIGPTLLSGQFSKGAALLVNQTWNETWRLGMGYTSEQGVVPRNEDFTEVRPNLFLHGQRIVSITDNFDLSLGVAYFNAKTRWNGSNFLASLSVEYHFNDTWSLNFRHFSNAGSASPNMGQDMFTVGYRF